MEIGLNEGKKCRVCGEFKSFDCFYRNSRSKDGRDHRCKDCEKIRLGYQKTIKRSKVVKEVIEGKEVVSKMCTKCDLIKPLFEFNDQPDGLLGKESHCKSCRLIYREENREYLASKAKEYYINNAEMAKKRSINWYFENHKRAREKRKEYYEINKEELSKKAKEYRKKNNEEIRKRGRNYYRNNKDKIISKLKDWKINNPHRRKISEHNRMARKKALPNTLNVEEYNIMMAFFGGRCALTGCDDIHIDHVIPLKVGHAGTVFGNMIPLSGKLNASKQDKNIFEWFEETKVENNLSQENFNKVINYLAIINDMTCEEYKDYVYSCHNKPKELLCSSYE